jgi:hypothetical protein
MSGESMASALVNYTEFVYDNHQGRLGAMRDRKTFVITSGEIRFDDIWGGCVSAIKNNYSSVLDSNDRELLRINSIEIFRTA